MTKGRAGRVKDAWKTSRKKPSAWWIIPEVSKRINYLITGEDNATYYEYISQKYFSEKKQLIGLSLGCGTGNKELIWAELSDFQKIEAYDISESRVEIARSE